MGWSLDPDGGQPINTPDYEPNSPEDYQDNEFLNTVDQGYIGYTQPETALSIDKGKDLWVIEDGKFKKIYVPESELADYTYIEGDNDPAGENEAWA